MPETLMPYLNAPLPFDIYSLHLHQPYARCVWHRYFLRRVCLHSPSSPYPTKLLCRILLFIVPPAGIAFIHVLAGITTLIGMCLGWAWGIISMKAALATRSTAETNARLAQLAAAAQGQITNAEQSSGQTTYSQVLIYEGFMLDARVVITYFCMLGLFVYLLARLRGVAPKLILAQIFGTVTVDIFLTIGPLLPSFEGSIAKVLVEPAAVAVALGMVSHVIFGHHHH